ncbi:LamG-like jellyroll fold domain-containing protein [Crateriforma conspicua]|uniref:FecR protein n=1 Tax=Crateriforma conspicua TaxID=2527996 RepID=A0A5C6FZ80_9PLAN|nr:LamG-like jellyroll fold domain-containing protein [Crateriforma conspicua]TWU66678.1 FecR protein [Crateriforma conspicua]
MSQSTGDWNRFDELVGSLREDDLSDDQSAELQHLLDSKPGARRRFAELMQLTAMLSDDAPSGSSAAIPYASPNLARKQANPWNRPAVAMALAVCATILLIVFWPGDPDRQAESLPTELLDEGVAVVTQSYDARWSGQIQLAMGSSVSPGRVTLESGLIQLEFYRGAVLVVEGPAELEFISADRLICHRGRLRARVPPQAEGFTVLSPKVELVDLGTEFGMDVASDGSASVHVFDGKVELYKSGTHRALATRLEFGENESAVIEADGEIVQSQDAAVDFVSTSKLSELSGMRDAARLRQWQVGQSQKSNDPRVILHYGFAKEEPSGRMLQSHLAQRGKRDGAIIGCRWTEGRWPGKDALEFKHPGDRIRLQIPGQYDSLTYSAWVRIDGLDRPFIALMLTNGYEVGEAHWQMRDDGRLLLGVKTPDGHVAYDSKPILNIKHLGRWTHLATVYDSRARKVSHFINGSRVGSSPIQTENFKLRFGETEIGNWGTPMEYSPQKIRNFNGKIDELTLFDAALSQAEIQSLYQSGRP